MRTWVRLAWAFPFFLLFLLGQVGEASHPSQKITPFDPRCERLLSLKNPEGIDFFVAGLIQQKTSPLKDGDLRLLNANGRATVNVPKQMISASIVPALERDAELLEAWFNEISHSYAKALTVEHMILRRLSDDQRTSDVERDDKGIPMVPYLKDHYQQALVARNTIILGKAIGKNLEDELLQWRRDEKLPQRVKQIRESFLKLIRSSFFKGNLGDEEDLEKWILEIGEGIEELRKKRMSKLSSQLSETGEKKQEAELILAFFEFTLETITDLATASDLRQNIEEAEQRTSIATSELQARTSEYINFLFQEKMRLSILELRKELVSIARAQGQNFEQDPDAELDSQAVVDLGIERVRALAGEFKALFPISNLPEAPGLDLPPKELKRGVDGIYRFDQGLANSPNQFLRPVQTEDGKIRLLLPRERTEAVFDSRMGTEILYPKIRSKRNWPTLGPLLELAHGAGTSKSNKRSWASVFPSVFAAGFNPFAPDNPGQGGELALSMNEFRSLREIVSYFRFRSRILYKDYQANRPNSDPLPPFLGLGRSMGSTFLFTVALMDYLETRWGIRSENQLSRYHAYYLTSFSNPFTIGPQIESIKEQFDQGRYEGLIWSSIEHAKDFCLELAQFLETVKQIDPKALDEFGDHLVFFQGESDLDGGPTVVKDLYDFVQSYAPKAHVRVIKNPALEFDPDGKKYGHYGDEMTAGSHYLLGSRTNFTRAKVGPDVYPGLPDSHLPKLKDQYHQIYLSIWMHLDHMILSSSTHEEAKTLLSQFRKHYCGTNYDHSIGFAHCFLNRSLDRVALPPEGHGGGQLTMSGRILEEFNYWRNQTNLPQR